MFCSSTAIKARACSSSILTSATTTFCLARAVAKGPAWLAVAVSVATSAKYCCLATSVRLGCFSFDLFVFLINNFSLLGGGCRFLLGFRLGFRLADRRVALDFGSTLLTECFDVALRVGNRLWIEHVDLDSQSREIFSRFLENFSTELLAVVDQLFDRQAPNDAAQVRFKRLLRRLANVLSRLAQEASTGNQQ